MRKPFDVFRESNPDICVGVRQPSFELNNVCGTIQWQCTEDDIHVPLDLILEPKLGLPVLLIKVVSKTFPTLLEYKNLIFWVPRVIVASILSYGAVHLIPFLLTRFGSSVSMP